GATSGATIYQTRAYGLPKAFWRRSTLEASFLGPRLRGRQPPLDLSCNRFARHIFKVVSRNVGGFICAPTSLEGGQRSRGGAAETGGSTRPLYLSNVRAPRIFDRRIEVAGAALLSQYLLGNSQSIVAGG